MVVSFQVTGITARPSLCTFPLLLFNFQGPSLSRFRLRSLAATRLVYHFLCSLSSTFFKFFQKFFQGGSRDAFRSLFCRSLPYSSSSSSSTIYTRFFGSPASHHPLTLRSILTSLPFVSSLSIPHPFIYCQVLLYKFFDIFILFFNQSSFDPCYFFVYRKIYYCNCSKLCYNIYCRKSLAAFYTRIIPYGGSDELQRSCKQVSCRLPRVCRM